MKHAKYMFRALLTAVFLLGISSASLLAQSNQADIAAGWKNGSYKSFRVSPSGVVYPGSKVELKVIKDEKGKAKRIELGGKSYVRDLEGISDFVRHFKCETEDQSIYFTKKGFYQFTYYPALFDDPDSHSRIYYSYGKKYVYTDDKDLTAYLEATRSEQEHDIRLNEAKIASKEQRAFEERGKNIASIEIVDVLIPEAFGHFRTFEFDIKATMKDGSVVYAYENDLESDYVITYGNAKVDGNLGELVDIKLLDGFVEGDEFTIEVASRYNPSITATHKVVPLYNEPLEFNYNARDWDMYGVGLKGHDFLVELKQCKHAKNQSDLLKVRITDVTTGEVKYTFKIGVDQTIHLLAEGYKGYDYDHYRYTDGIRGGRGGDGGNLLLIKDPNVKSFKLNRSLWGGRAGKGLVPSHNGEKGKEGEYTIEVAPVDL